MKHDEENLQCACVRWFDLQYPRFSLLLHHSPNGGFRNKLEAVRFKRMGVRAGFPDLILLVPRGGCPFLGIELKTDKGRQSTAQKAYQEAFIAIGARYEVVRSIEEFMNVVKSYLNKAL